MKNLLDHHGRKRVVITGMDFISPYGLGLAEAFPQLLAGKSCIEEIKRFDTSAFVTKFAGEIPDALLSESGLFNDKDLRRNDRCILFALLAAELALRSAGLPSTLAASNIAPERIAVIVGSGLGGLATLEQNHRILLEKGPTRVSPFFVPATIANLIAGQISIRTGALGPSWTPVSACASGAHAIGEALELIRRGGADLVLCGGAEATVTPLGIGGFNALKALSTRNEAPKLASRPWDKDRDGFVMSEGAGILVLESLEQALKRDVPIIAELSGYGTTCDAHHITTPSGEGAQRSLQLALQDAALNHDEVDYINAHGTSTQIGDLEEVQVLKKVFKEHSYRLAISSTKSLHGHFLGAAGAIEAILTAKMLQTRCLLPTINLFDPSEECDLDFIPHESREQASNIACSNSFGFGGTNVTLAFKAWS